MEASPYRSPPGVSVELVFMEGWSSRAHAEKRLEQLLAAGYSVASHSGTADQYGSYRALWTLVRSEGAAP